MTGPPRFFESTEELRSWFLAHHADTTEVWIGFHKAHTGRSGVGYLAAVEEALCFGWIDTTVRRIDDDRYMHRFTPRRPGSYWSVVNRHRFAELAKRGRVHEAGRRAFAGRAKTEPTRYTSERSVRFAPEFALRLREVPAADRFFRSRPRSFRRIATWWVMSAVRPETRERRFATLLAALRQGEIPSALRVGDAPPASRRPSSAGSP